MDINQGPLGIANKHISREDLAKNNNNSFKWHGKAKGQYD